MKIKLLDFKELKNFPSGSGIEYHNEKLYLVGDDAKEILIMNKKWKQLDTIPLFKSAEARIPKKIKADLEATTVIEVNKIPRLLAMGSGSTENRNKAFLVNLDDNTSEELDISVFYNRLRSVLPVVNIESAAIVLDKVLLGNRGNRSAPDNHLVVTDLDFWKHQETAEIVVTKFDLPYAVKQPIGLSGLSYSHRNDWLIGTLSTENTENAVDDGPVGDSYVAIVENASRKILHKRMKVNELINLVDANKAFKRYKMESIGIQTEKNGRLKMHLVADNDTGVSYMFKVQLKE